MPHNWADGGIIIFLYFLYVINTKIHTHMYVCISILIDKCLLWDESGTGSYNFEI